MFAKIVRWYTHIRGVHARLFKNTRHDFDITHKIS